MSRSNVVFRESHMTDGQIHASVSLDEETIGNVYLTLSQWDRLRSAYTVRVISLSEQSDTEDALDEEKQT